jgi:hypothetical protein
VIFNFIVMILYDCSKWPTPYIFIYIVITVWCLLYNIIVRKAYIYLDLGYVEQSLHEMTQIPICHILLYQYIYRDLCHSCDDSYIIIAKSASNGPLRNLTIVSSFTPIRTPRHQSVPVYRFHNCILSNKSGVFGSFRVIKRIFSA